MNDTDILTLLKTSLGEPNASQARTSLLQNKIDLARTLIKDEGITLSSASDVGGITADDAGLIEMYAEFLVVKRETAEGMPRYLRWALNNRLIKQRAEADNED